MMRIGTGIVAEFDCRLWCARQPYDFFDEPLRATGIMKSIVFCLKEVPHYARLKISFNILLSQCQC